MPLLSFFKRIFVSEPALADKVKDARPPNLVQTNEGSTVVANNINIAIGNLITVKECDFYGVAHYSPNNLWCVSTRESNGHGRGGKRENESENGEVILVDLQTKHVVDQVSSFERPLNAAVSNNGTYIIHDALFGSNLQSSISVRNKDGECLYTRRYNANIYNIDISHCGQFVVIQTANAPSSDGYKIELINVIDKSVLFSVSPATGLADKFNFEFDASGQLSALTVVHNSLGSFRYLPSGAFIDGDALISSSLNCSNYAIKLSCARELISNNKDKDICIKVIEATKSALIDGAQSRPDWCAEAYRIMGESFEILGRYEDAIEAYDRALQQNPNIGVKRKANSIRKRLNNRNNK